MASRKASGKRKGRPPLILAEITITNPSTGRKKRMLRGDAIVEFLRRGLYARDAAKLAGVGETTFHDWIARGEEYAETPIEEVPESERIYAAFSASVEKARAEAVKVALDQIRSAASGGVWQAAAWFLERTRPHDYGRIERREITGADGGPITLLDLELEVAEEGSE